MSSKHSAAFTGGSGKPRLIVQIRDAIRVRHYSYRTEQAYVAWIRRFILFHGKRHPIQMGGDEVRGFLSWLASERDVAAATQAQALAAILFLYKHVLDVDLPWVENVVRARRPKRLPVVLTRGEVRQVLRELQADYWLVASLLYGSGLRLMEGLRLRVKDLDLERRELVVRSGKGDKDRVSVIPLTLVEPLRMRCTASIHALRWNWAGSMSFRWRARRAIRAREPGAARASASRPPVTPSATASRRTCWNPAPTSVRCRNC